ncbi:MAG: PLP-dependent transferase [Pseudomonadota bacterium]
MTIEIRNDERGDPVIQHQVLRDFTLSSGATLDEARLGYCVFGDPAQPLVLLHPALTGTPRASVSGRQSQGDGWWTRCVGPGKFLDTKRVCVICVDQLGGYGASTGAGELGPHAETLAFRDTVLLAARALRGWGVETLHAVVGGSIGGGQALEWLFQEEIRVERLFDISGSTSRTGPAAEFFRLQADLILSAGGHVPEIRDRLVANSRDLVGKTTAFDRVFDHVLAGFDRLQAEFSAEAALALTRKIGFLRFVTPRFYQQRWDEDLARWTDEARTLAGTLAWLDHQGETFVRRFSPEGFACLCRMESMAVPREAGELARRIEETGCQLVGFSVSGDVLFDAEEQFQFYRSVKEQLPEGRKSLVEIYFTYDDVNGHDHFLTPGFLDSVPGLARHLYGPEAMAGFATRAIHRGHDFRDTTGALIPPIYLTSTFERGNKAGFDYTRSGNPNFINLEEILASLEGANHATVFASGVSAITAVVSSLKSGDLVIAEEVIYGCTYRLFDQVFSKFGVRIEYLDFTREESFRTILEKKPVLVWIESPTNPLLKVIDIKEVSKYTTRAGSTLLVDNTFASSFFQQPLALGADLSLSSTTKYINGHSDCLGGVVCTNDPVWKGKMVFAQKALGLNPSPFDSWLITRGLKTLTLRMQRHEENALALAEYLEGRPETLFVRYPFHPSHPEHEAARRQMSGGSGVVTVLFDMSLEEVGLFLTSLENFTLAESLGGIESLVCHPATMSHASVPVEQRNKLGITDALVRFSVGVEQADDLIADIDQALARLRG